MRILVTNDDGVFAAGLQALAAALEAVGEVTIVAPEREQSAISHAITMHKPLRVREVQVNGRTALVTNGTPVDCVLLAVRKLLAEPPEVVIAGINRGANLGEDILYSGTVSAAMEAALLDLPAFAISVVTRRVRDFTPAARFAAALAPCLVEHPLPPRTFLNVNVPDCAWEEIRGVRIVRQGFRNYRSTYEERQDPRGDTYYWIGGELPVDEPVPGTDIAAIREGYIAVMPVQLDLTAHAFLEELVGWQLERLVHPPGEGTKDG